MLHCERLSTASTRRCHSPRMQKKHANPPARHKREQARVGCRRSAVSPQQSWYCSQSQRSTPSTARRTTAAGAACARSSPHQSAATRTPRPLRPPGCRLWQAAWTAGRRRSWSRPRSACAAARLSCQSSEVKALEACATTVDILVRRGCHALHQQGTRAICYLSGCQLTTMPAQHAISCVPTWFDDDACSGYVCDVRRAHFSSASTSLRLNQGLKYAGLLGRDTCRCEFGRPYEKALRFTQARRLNMSMSLRICHQQRALLPHGVQEGLQVSGRQQELQQVLRAAQCVWLQRLRSCESLAPRTLCAANSWRLQKLSSVLQHSALRVGGCRCNTSCNVSLVGCSLWERSQRCLRQLSCSRVLHAVRRSKV